LHSNGTIETGDLHSTGQIYFDEALEERIMALEPYASHTQINRTTNTEDTVFAFDTYNGYNPVVSIEPLDGENVDNGMIGYITIGVDLTADGIADTANDGTPDDVVNSTCFHTRC
jgi:hypothetical protein